jgi:predicted lysophospholipase L1 biosynthesis ABC-type transport system permease subunit
VVVNEAFARRYFNSDNPIGKRIGYGPPASPHYWRTIIGMAADTRERLGEPSKPTAYAPFRQNLEPWNSASYLVRTGLPVAGVADAIRSAVIASDPDQPVARVRAVEADMRATIAAQRFTTSIATMFAGLALILALVGTFGVMSHVVRGRTREIGVRIALGATRRDIVTLVLGQAGRVVVAAIVAGLGAALLVGTSMQGLLYEVRPRDPWTLGVAALLLTFTALAASYVPIRRVLAQNPLASLRETA